MSSAPLNWFETWFDTPLYEALYAHRDHAEALRLAQLINTHFPPQTHRAVVDIACGRGRHSFNLASLGYEVTGVDLSVNAIRQAKAVASQQYPNLPLTFYTHDMREPLGQTWPLAVNLFTSFGYMPDDAQNFAVLKNMTEAVASEGALVLDYLNPSFVQATLIDEEMKTIPGYELHIRRSIEKKTVSKSMTFRSTETGQVQTFTERVMLYDQLWFGQAYAKLGLKLQVVYGDYSGKPFFQDDDNHPRMILFAEKKP